MKINFFEVQKSKYLMENHINQPTFLEGLPCFKLSSRCFEFWDIEVCCNRNAFTKLSPYIYLKKDTENYIKYIDFSVEVKCPYS